MKYFFIKKTLILFVRFLFVQHLHKSFIQVFGKNNKRVKNVFQKR